MLFSEEDVKNKFPDRIDDFILLIEKMDNGIVKGVEISVFVKRFKGAELTQVSLLSHSNAKDGWENNIRMLFNESL